ncbi:MAG TPA: rod shape-determining protein [Patescibacteria group bacterium]|nr:rod shape-determining protein [Patescibacteria group bacterium]
MLGHLWGALSHDIGIDLGTANTLVLVSGKGIVIREPSIVAIHKKSKQIVAVGSEAKKMVGKMPSNLAYVRPLRDGVISDFDMAMAMLQHFIKAVHVRDSFIPKIPRPRVVIGIPSGVTAVEKRAVQDATLNAGAREAYLVEEAMAAAVGAGLPIDEATGSMIVDVGGGTTEIATISLGGMVASRSLRVAGDEMDQDIINYARSRHNLLIGERTAEEVKIAVGNAYPTKDSRKTRLRGRDLATGLPKEVAITSEEAREAISGTLNQIVLGIKDTIEDTPPEIVSDFIERGVVITGGGALLPGMAEKIAKELGMPVRVADDPLTTVVRGTGIILQDVRLLDRVRSQGGLSQ